MFGRRSGDINGRIRHGGASPLLMNVWFSVMVAIMVGGLCWASVKFLEAARLNHDTAETERYNLEKRESMWDRIGIPVRPPK